MAHKHTCLTCGKIIEESEFDCELDRDHDLEDCAKCSGEIVRSADDVVSYRELPEEQYD